MTERIQDIVNEDDSHMYTEKSIRNLYCLDKEG